MSLVNKTKTTLELLESVLGDLNSHFEEYKKSKGRSLSDRYDIQTYAKSVLYYINLEINSKDIKDRICVNCQHGFYSKTEADFKRALNNKSIQKVSNGFIHYNCFNFKEVKQN